MNVWDAIDGSSLVSVARSVGFCFFVVLLVRLRPWRWLSSWVRHRG